MKQLSPPKPMLMLSMEEYPDQYWLAITRISVLAGLIYDKANLAMLS